jgi:hypothetical protein
MGGGRNGDTGSDHVVVGAAHHGANYSGGVVLDRGRDSKVNIARCATKLKTDFQSSFELLSLSRQRLYEPPDDNPFPRALEKARSGMSCQCSIEFRIVIAPHRREIPSRRENKDAEATATPS